MKTRFIIIVAALAPVALFAATGSSTAQARIGAPLVITAGDALSFGTVFVTDQVAGGTVTIGWDGTAMTTAGSGAATVAAADVNDTNWVVTADDPALGTFTVAGPPAAVLTYGVTVAAGTLTFAGTCPVGYTCGAMTFIPTIEDPSSATGFGSTTFKVGGTLTVAADQGEGSYTGTYDIEANYQ